MRVLSPTALPLRGRCLRQLSYLLVLLCVVAMLAAQEANAAGVYTQAAAALQFPPGVTPVTNDWEMYGTACSSTDSCVAVGFFDNNHQAFAYVAPVTDGEPGTGVSVVLPANASTTVDADLDGVACQSGNVCTAYGSYEDNTDDSQMMVVQITKGVPARAVEVTPPADAMAGELYPQAISCPVTGACVIAGYYENTTDDDEPLIVSVNNGVPSAAVSISIPANHDPSYADGELAGVACQSAGACTAVGYYDSVSGSHVGMVVQINSGTPGAGVETVPGDAYSGGPDADVEEVACPSSGACEAIGTYRNNSDAEVNFAEPISGGTPGPAVGFAAPAGYLSSAAYVLLSGLSCSSASMCVGAGYYEVSGGADEAALVTITASGVSAQETALPADAYAGFQDAAFYEYDNVSCVPAGMCVAAGYYKLGSESYTGMLQEISASGQVGSAEQAPDPADTEPNTTEGPGPYALLDSGIGCDLSGSCVATGEYFNTAGVEVPYEVTLQAPASLSTSSLADATENSPYSTTLAAAGAWGIYSWSIASGNLPAGLTLNAQTGVISGTPTGSGSSTFTAQVTGTGSPVPIATQALTLTVAALTPRVSVLSASGKLTADKLGVKLRCAAAPCSGTVKLEITKVVTIKHGKKRVRKHETVVIGTASYSIAAGAGKTLTVKLNGAGRAALAKAKKHRLAVTVIATVKGGSNASRHETIFTKSKRKKR
jgi:hypothetical protein